MMMTQSKQKMILLLALAVSVLIAFALPAVSYQRVVQPVNNLKMLAVVPGEPLPHNVMGTVYLEGRSMGQHTGITVTLHTENHVGSDTIVAGQVRPAGNGIFVLQTPPIPDGIYVVRGDRLGYLKIQSDLVAIAGEEDPSNVHVGVMLAGDLNADNEVSDTDVVLLGKIYGETNENSDFDGDGSVDKDDARLLDKNYEAKGE